MAHTMTEKQREETEMSERNSCWGRRAACLQREKKTRNTQKKQHEIKRKKNN